MKKGLIEDEMIDSITYSGVINLNILQDIVENGRAWYPAIHGVERVRRDLLTEQQQQFHN